MLCCIWRWGGAVEVNGMERVAAGGVEVNVDRSGRLDMRDSLAGGRFGLAAGM